MAKMVLLSGPSCVGKSPLIKAFRQLYPDRAQAMEKLVLYNDRAPRPGEKDGEDYYFRSRQEIERLREDDDYRVIEVRGDLQAVHLPDIHRILEGGKQVFYEGAPYVITALREEPTLREVEKVTVFLSPLTREEVLFFQDPERNTDIRKLITNLMRKKLLRRKQKQMNILSLPDLEDIEIRCHAAYRELQEAHRFDYVIPNHDGEDSGNWSDFYYPIGEARQAVQVFAAILEGNPQPWVELWDADLLPSD